MSDEEKKIPMNLALTKPQTSSKLVNLRSDFFKFLQLNLDQYDNVKFTTEEAKKVRAHMSHLSTGAAAVLPLICPGEVKCPFAKNCPFVKVDQERTAEYNRAKALQTGRLDVEIPKPEMSTPVGKQCLVEVSLMNEWTEYYVEEFDVPEKSFIELSSCRELAEIEVMLWRINNNMSKLEHSEMTQLDVVGIDKEGNLLTKKTESSLMLVKERLLNRKTRLIKNMVGDRQEKYKKEAALKIKDNSDPSTKAAQLRRDINSTIKQLEGKVIELQEAEGNVIDVVVEEKKEDEVTPESLIDDHWRKE